MMNKYHVKLVAEGDLDIDEPIEAEDENEAYQIAMNEYGDAAFYGINAEIDLIEGDEDEEDNEETEEDMD